MESGNQDISTPSRRRQKCSSDDRISDLPVHIIYHILSLLPTKNAVITSFLSKNWRRRWTNVTTFDFNDRGWPKSDRLLPERSGVAAESMDFVEFVLMVFANHRAEIIEKFRLRWKSVNVRSIYLSIWINAAIAKNLKVLDLATVPRPRPESRSKHSVEDFKFNLPGALYTCGTLEVLKLRGPFFIQLPHVVHLPKLAVLKLCLVRYEFDQSVDKLISGCPMLECLAIEKQHYHGDQDQLLCRVSSSSLRVLEIYFDGRCECRYVGADLRLEIDAPALEALDLYNHVCENILIQDVTSLKRVDVDIVGVVGLDDSVGLVEAFHGVEDMALRTSTMIALGAATRTLSASFEILTKLTVDRSECSVSGWSLLVDLIDLCVRLEVLDINVFTLDSEEELPDEIDEEGLDLEAHAHGNHVFEQSGPTQWKKPTCRVPRCFLSSLKQFNFRSFHGREDEMEFLEYILGHGLLI